MQTGMLGNNKVLHEFWNGPLSTLLERINGPEGEKELEAFKRFLRKENPWPPLVAPRPARISGFTEVNLGALPYLPTHCRVERHDEGSIVKVQKAIDTLKVNGYPVIFRPPGTKAMEGESTVKDLWVSLTNSQKSAKCWEAGEFSFPNANLLDALLRPENQCLIPVDWTSLHHLFLGTEYVDQSGIHFFRALYKHAGGWSWARVPFDATIGDGFRPVLLAGSLDS